MDSIKELIKDESLSRLCKEAAIRKLSIFGSFARGEEHEDSDIDLLAEFSRLPGMLEFMRIRRRLEEYFKKEVDLLTLSSLDDDMLKNIKKQMKIIYESN